MYPIASQNLLMCWLLTVTIVYSQVDITCRATMLLALPIFRAFHI